MQNAGLTMRNLPTGGERGLDRAMVLGLAKAGAKSHTNGAREREEVGQAAFGNLLSSL